MTEIEPGRYICVRTSGFVPWLICAATHSRVNHAAIVVGGGQVVEAEPQGVIISPLSKYAGAYAVANIAEPMTRIQCAAVEAKALSLAGTGYNFAAIGDDAAISLGWHWEFLIHLAQADHELDCSQLAAACGTAAGLDWLGGRTATSEVTPGDLARRPGVHRVVIT